MLKCLDASIELLIVKIKEFEKQMKIARANFSV